VVVIVKVLTVFCQWGGMAERTHPGIASLVDPLFAARKEDELQFLFFALVGVVTNKTGLE